MGMNPGTYIVEAWKVGDEKPTRGRIAIIR
jgi:hypothetical protein